jgi:hypothetical protein
MNNNNNNNNIAHQHDHEEHHECDDDDDDDDDDFLGITPSTPTFPTSISIFASSNSSQDNTAINHTDHDKKIDDDDGWELVDNDSEITSMKLMEDACFILSSSTSSVSSLSSTTVVSNQNADESLRKTIEFIDHSEYSFERTPATFSCPSFDLYKRSIDELTTQNNTVRSPSLPFTDDATSKKRKLSHTTANLSGTEVVLGFEFQCQRSQDILNIKSVTPIPLHAYDKDHTVGPSSNLPTRNSTSSAKNNRLAKSLSISTSIGNQVADNPKATEILAIDSDCSSLRSTNMCTHTTNFSQSQSSITVPASFEDIEPLSPEIAIFMHSSSKIK